MNTMPIDTDTIICERRLSGGDPGFRALWLEELCEHEIFDRRYFGIVEKVIGNKALHEFFSLMVPKLQQRNKIMRSVNLPGFSGTKTPSFKRLLAIAAYAKSNNLRSDVEGLEKDIELYRQMVKQKLEGTFESSESDVEDVKSERARGESPARNRGQLRARSSSAQGHDRRSGQRKRSRLSEQGPSLSDAKRPRAHDPRVIKQQVPFEILRNWGRRHGNQWFEQFHAMDEIQRHKSKNPISKELLSYAGCTLKGWYDSWNGRVTSYCSITSFGSRASRDIQEFLDGGVYSFPCYNENWCKQWLFFKARDFPDNDKRCMDDYLGDCSWYRLQTDDQRRKWYVKCPGCAPPCRC